MQLESHICPDTGTIVYSTPQHVKEELAAREALKAENDRLKNLLDSLIALQPKEIQDKLLTPDQPEV